MLTRKQRFLADFFLVLIWIIAINFHSGVAILSIKSFTNMTGIEPHLEGNILANYWVAPTQFIESSLFGLFFGLAFVWVDRRYRKAKYAGMSFGSLILRKSLFYLGSILFAFGAIFVILRAVGIYPQELSELVRVDRASIALIFLIFSGVTGQILFMNFLVQTIENTGSYNILRFLTGKFQEPVEEERIFMFLDLKDSTGHAEKLGNLQYSQMIRDCFNDLNQVLKGFKAEIYQYVGDEVVLTWDKLTKDNNRDCIRFFYAYKAYLDKKRDTYINKYSITPEFKAGCHEGKVMVTEVGFIKREIVFHGDVLNTASRIQKLNKELKTDILISGKMKEMLENLHGMQLKSFGSFQLRGKDKKTEIFEVNLLNTQLN